MDPNITCSSRVMNIFTNCPGPVEPMLNKASSVKKDCYVCQWLDNVDMHTGAKFDYNIPSGSRVMNIFTIFFLITGNGWIDRRT